MCDSSNHRAYQGFVVTEEVGDFATRGDSGSLVVCTTTNLVLGVVSKCENDKNWIRCVKMQYLYEIDSVEVAAV